MQRQPIYKAAGFKVKDIDEAQGIVQAYIAVFGNKDGDGDIIQKGAYTKTIQENFPRIAHLKNHDSRKAVGLIKNLEQDNFGLLMTSQLSKSQLGRDTLIEYMEGIIKEHSQGFITMKEEYDNESQTNIIKEISLWEGSSLTAWAANPLARTVSVKSATDIIEEMKQIEKGLKIGSFSDEYLINLEAQYKSLNEAIKPHLDALKAKNEPNGDNELVEQFLNSKNLMI